MTSHDIGIREGQFATPQDFDPTAKAPSTTNMPERPSSPKPIYDTIEVQHPPKVVGFAHVAKIEKSTSDKPTYEEAMNGPDKDKWVAAMKEELESIHRNETARLVKCLRGRKLIGVKWVLTVKRDAKGKIIKHKARLVAKGYSQQFRIRLRRDIRPCCPDRACTDTIRPRGFLQSPDNSFGREKRLPKRQKRLCNLHTTTRWIRRYQLP
jgi:hypothetical protein